MSTEPPSLAFQGRRRWLFVLILAGAVLTLYSVSLGHNFLFDEESIILKNPLIRSFSSIPDLFTHGYFYTGLPQAGWNDYYRPLTLLTFMVDFHFWKVDPFGYNLVNAGLHFAVVFLLYRFISDILRHDTAAFLAAFLFAVHPLATEATTYLASRGDLLGAILSLGALIFYFHGKSLQSLLGFGLALFSKESTLLTPLYLLLVDWTVHRDSWKKRAQRLWPFVALAGLYLAFRKFACAIPLGPPHNDIGEGLLRVLSMGPPFLSYLQAIVMPEKFQFSLSVDFAREIADLKVAVTLAVTVILLAAWAAAARRRGAAFLGMGIFLVALLPYLEFIHFYPEWAEHYLYFPAAGLALLFGAFSREILLSENKAGRAAFFAAVAFFGAFWSLRTWQRNTIYNDPEVYFDYLSKSGARYAHFGYQNLGRIALENGRADQAIVPLKTAELIEPRAAVTHNLLALYYLQKDELAEALEHFELAYHHEPQNFIYRINSSHVLMRLERYREVIQILEETQKKIPQYASLYINILTAHELLGENEKASAWAQRGLVETAGRPWEHATMYMAAARFWYRQGRDDKTKALLGDFEAKYLKSFWYGDVLRLLNGTLSPEDFLEKTHHAYPGFQKIAGHYVLMSHVLLNRRERIAPFLESCGPDLEKTAQRQPLIKKEVERARALTL